MTFFSHIYGKRKLSMEKEKKDIEKRLRFVVRYYKEGHLDAEKAWKRFVTERGIRRPVVWLRRYWVAAASFVLLLLGVGAFYLTERNQPDWVAVSTAEGQVKEMCLPDSTQVLLAGNSSFRYDRKRFGKQHREVEMTGKVFYEVRRNEACPFTVRAACTEVTVLGTRFQVNEQEGKTEVNVMSGKVRFAAATAPQALVLTAGMSAVYSEAEKQIHSLEEEDWNVFAWKTKRLRFEDTLLEQVIEDLNACYGVQIACPDSLPALRLTVTLDSLSLDEALGIINQTLDIQLSYDRRTR